jgi:hypothetical protein
VFAVVWTTHAGDFWAALHDFEQSAQRRLLEVCRQHDHDANGSAGIHP